MPKLILKSQVAQFDDFAGAVEAHAKELSLHADHMVLVNKANAARLEMAKVDADDLELSRAAANEKNPKAVADIARKQASLRLRRDTLLRDANAAQYYPPPGAPPLVDAAVARGKSKDGQPTFTVDYELVDVIPLEAGDEAGLRRVKDQHLSAVSVLEGAAINALVPPGKRRSLQFRVQDINAADSKRRDKIMAALKGEAVDLTSLQKQVASGRPAEDTKFLAEQAACAATIDRIHRFAAAQHDEIEDLTTDNAHTWAPRPFPK